MKLTAENVISMIQCQNCGQGNAPESQFCRFCGTKFFVPQPMRQEPFDPQPRRPYSWKTDEFQTQSDARRPGPQINQVQPLGNQNAFGNQNYGSQSLTYAASHQFAGNYRCPNCMSQFLPVVERRISTAGWVTFAVLMAVFFPLFWIGLLIKEDVHICPTCKTRLR